MVLAAGALCTSMAIWPLAVLRVLRKYVTGAVAVAMLYFTVQLLRNPIPHQTGTSWSGFFPAVDAALALSVSFLPMAADYMRHARSSRQAGGAAVLGYSITQFWCYAIGIVALLQAPNADVFHTMLGVTAGWLFFLVLVLRESDQSFANVYSTAMSIQNLLPRVDRRILAGGVGVLVTVIALFVHDLGGFSNFLGLIGSVFVPLAAVLGVDYFLGRGRQGRWDLSEHSPARPAMLLPWALGFVVYQVLNPGSVTWWAHGWMHVQDWVHVHPGWWASASLYSFAAAALATGAIVALDRRRAPRPEPATPAETLRERRRPRLRHGGGVGRAPGLAEPDLGGGRGGARRRDRRGRVAQPASAVHDRAGPDRRGPQLIVKRLPLALRTPEALAEEHGFMDHLRERGHPGPRSPDRRRRWRLRLRSPGTRRRRGPVSGPLLLVALPVRAMPAWPAHAAGRPAHRSPKTTRPRPGPGVR